MSGDNSSKRAHTRIALSESDEEVLARLKKLSDQLDAAKNSAELTAREIARAKDTTEATRRAVRLHRSAHDAAKPKRRPGKKR